MKNEQPQSVQRRRLKIFGVHMAGYFIVVAIIFTLNMMDEPQNPWFMIPMVGWGSVLALHAAFVMGLFDSLRK